MAKLHDLPVSTVMKVVEAVEWLGECHLDTLCEFTKWSATTVRRALNVAEALGMVDLSSEQIRKLESARLRGGSDGVKASVFRQCLQGYRPFELICELLAEGNPQDDALRKARVLLNGEGGSLDLRPLIRWGLDLGLLKRGARNSLNLAPDLQAAVTEPKGISLEALESEMATRLFVSHSLGVECYEYLGRSERERLRSAVASALTDPEKAGEDAGKALENSLRLVARGRGIDVSKATGIEQLAQMLRNNNVILAKHVQLCTGLNAVRIASAHDMDKDTNLPWAKTAETALPAVLLVLRVIRSIHLWVQKGQQEM